MLPSFANKYKDNRFYCERLTSNTNNIELIKDFYIEREKNIIDYPDKIIGLQQYLKKAAWDEDLDNLNRVFLINDCKTNTIVAYFGLKASLVSVRDKKDNDIDYYDIIKKQVSAKVSEYILIEESIPAIELSHFAINDCFRKKICTDINLKIYGFGKLFFQKYIYSIVTDVHNKLGSTIFICLQQMIQKTINL